MRFFFFFFYQSACGYYFRLSLHIIFALALSQVSPFPAPGLNASLMLLSCCPLDAPCRALRQFCPNTVPVLPPFSEILPAYCPFPTLKCADTFELHSGNTGDIIRNITTLGARSVMTLCSCPDAAPFPPRLRQHCCAAQRIVDN